MMNSRYGLRQTASRARTSGTGSSTAITATGNSVPGGFATPGDIPGEYAPSSLNSNAGGEAIPPPPGQPVIGAQDGTPSSPGSGEEEAHNVVLAQEAPELLVNSENDIFVRASTNSHAAGAGLFTPRGRSRSLGSPVRRPFTPVAREQENLIDIAQSRLTRPQRDLITRSNERIRESIRRGKQVDPREWGAVNIPEHELDVEAQQRELEILKAMQAPKPADAEGSRAQDSRENDVHTETLKEKSKKDAYERRRSKTAPLSGEMTNLIDTSAKGKKKKKKQSKSKKSKKSRRDKEMERLLPSKQVAKDSFLGRALSAKPRKRRDDSSESSDSSDSSPSESSDSEDQSTDSNTSDDDDSTSEDSSDDSSLSSDSSDDPSDSSESESDSGKKNRKKKSKKSRKSKKKKSALKPIAPESYDGTADPRSFHKLVTAVKYYLQDGNVPKNRHIYTVSQFLEGKAYDYYTREYILKRNKNKDVSVFFQGLFNYCFPVDYREQQRARLRRCYQNNRAVKEYVAELEELFITVGYTDKRERVRKLWDGLRTSIKKALYKDKLHPEISKWDRVVQYAELNEIAESVSEQHGDVQNRDRGKTQNGSADKRASRSESDDNEQPNKGKRNKRRGSFGKKTNATPGFSSSRDKQKQWADREVSKSKFREISPRKRDELRAQNRCFECEETGHQARHCPNKNKLPQGTSKYPLNNHNIELDIGEIETLRESDSFAESLDFGMIHFEIDADDSDVELDRYSDAEFTDYRNYLFIKRLEVPLTKFFGDPIAARAEAMLFHWSTYPGDELFDPIDQPAIDDGLLKRFVAVKTTEHLYTIIDDRQDRAFTIEAELLKDPLFNVAQYYWDECLVTHGITELRPTDVGTVYIPDAFAFRAEQVLFSGRPYPGEFGTPTYDSIYRFAARRSVYDENIYNIMDHELKFKTSIHRSLLECPQLDLVSWYRKKVYKMYQELSDTLLSHVQDFNFLTDEREDTYFGCLFDEPLDPLDALVIHFMNMPEDESYLATRARTRPAGNHDQFIELNGQQVERGTYPALQRNTSAIKDPKRAVPKPVVIKVWVDGHPCQALLDTGSLGDFMSNSLAEQLKVKRIELSSPIPVQLAVQGSRTKINFGVRAEFQYQDINEPRYFYIINISNYDLILGTPFLFQHQVSVGINPARVVVGSTAALQMKGEGVTTITSHSMALYEEIEDVPAPKKDNKNAAKRGNSKAGKESAAPMAHHFALKGPEERQEGGSQGNTFRDSCVTSTTEFGFNAPIGSRSSKMNRKPSKPPTCAPFKAPPRPIHIPLPPRRPIHIPLPPLPPQPALPPIHIHIHNSTPLSQPHRDQNHQRAINSTVNAPLAPVIAPEVKNFRWNQETLLAELTARNGTITSYHPATIRLYFLFDHAVRQKRTQLVTPGGFREFTRTLAEVAEIPNKLVQFNQATRQFVAMSQTPRIPTRLIDFSMFNSNHRANNRHLIQHTHRDESANLASLANMARHLQSQVDEGRGYHSCGCKAPHLKGEPPRAATPHPHSVSDTTPASNTATRAYSTPNPTLLDLVDIQSTRPIASTSKYGCDLTSSNIPTGFDQAMADGISFGTSTLFDNLPGASSSSSSSSTSASNAAEAASTSF